MNEQLHDHIDGIATGLTDEQREAYIEANGWRFAGAGWFSPGSTSQELPGGVVIHTAGPGGSFSLSVAIREQLAREAGLPANPMGRSYQRDEPEGSFGKRW